MKHALYALTALTLRGTSEAKRKTSISIFSSSSFWVDLLQRGYAGFPDAGLPSRPAPPSINLIWCRLGVPHVSINGSAEVILWRCRVTQPQHRLWLFLCSSLGGGFTAEKKPRFVKIHAEIWSCGLIWLIPNHKSMKCFPICHWQDACVHASVPSDPTMSSWKLHI